MKFDLSILNKYVKDTIVCVEKHPDADLYIYGYYNEPGKKCVWDDISIHCRGMIVDGHGNVVEHPFKKFWTFKQYLTPKTILLNENQIKRIPEGKIRILEKIDGTMCTLYWINDKPYLATQRSFTNTKALEATKILYDRHAEDIKKLDRRFTYIFEAVYPESNVLIDYGDTRDLYLIGIIDKETMNPVELPDIGFPVARDFTSQYGHLAKLTELEALNLPNMEGFVIYYENGEMIKLKFPWYKAAHRLLDNIFFSDKNYYRNQRDLRALLHLPEIKVSNIDVWESLVNGDIELYTIKSRVPSYFYLMGFENWLKQIRESIQKDASAGGINGKNFKRPETLSIFDIDDRFNHPHIYESIAINWKKRYLNT